MLWEVCILGILPLKLVQKGTRSWKLGAESFTSIFLRRNQEYSHIFLFTKASRFIYENLATSGQNKGISMGLSFTFFLFLILLKKRLWCMLHF